MNNLKFESPDMTAKNIDRIAALFPNCITEMLDEEHSTPEKKVYKRAVNFELLKQMLSSDVVDGDEAYEFTWVGKKAAIVEANKPIRKMLRPCVAESKDWDTTENLYIEGDNLEVLKLLQESYLGKVKMIYIDPPYNTGNDFIYADDFMRSQEEENEQMGMFDENENRLFKNTDTNGRFHSDWCSMIYSRLILARNLLASDGVIAISISYNELHNLMKMCQEIFSGHQVFSVSVQTSGGKPNGAFNISNEYVVFVIPQQYKPTPTEEDMKEYSSPYHGMNLATFNQTERPNQTYPVFVSSDGVLIGCGKTLQERIDEGTFSGALADFTFDYTEAPEGSCAIWPVTAKGEPCVWRLIPSRLISDWGKGYIKIVRQSGSKNAPFSIQYLSGGIIDKIESGEFTTYKISENKDIPTVEVKNYKTAGSEIPSVWTDKNFYTSKGNDEIKNLFDGKLFSYPKPLSLIRYIVKRTTGNSGIVLDFFSGSATTAHAVMQLNAEDGGHRKFIMVQLPEKCDEKSEAYKAGYKNICEIGKERIRRAGEKLLQEVTSGEGNINGEGWGCGLPTTPDERALAIKNILDVGFRVLKLDDTNMKDVYYAPDDYDQGMLAGLESNIKDDRTDLDLLFGCLIDWGLPLSLPYKSEKIDGCTVHTYNDGDLIACFDTNIPESVVKEIAKRKPLRAVFRDSGFASSPEKINVFEIFKLYMPEDANDITKRLRVI